MLRGICFNLLSSAMIERVTQDASWDMLKRAFCAKRHSFSIPISRSAAIDVSYEDSIHTKNDL